MKSISHLNNGPRGSTRTKKLHPNDLRSLKPADFWRVLIDETGSIFGLEAEHLPTESPDLGRFVAVALPGTTPKVPPLAPSKGKRKTKAPMNASLSRNLQTTVYKKGWHASEKGSRAIDRVVENLLNSNAGIFGFCTTGVPANRDRCWVDGVGLLIDWVLRLLPINGNTSIRVLVENRAQFKAGDSWEAVARMCLLNLRLADESRAKQIRLSIDIVGKNDSAYIGYADAIAYTWARRNEKSHERLLKSGLLHTCLLESNAFEMLVGWDAARQGTALPAEKWWDLVSSPEATESGLFLARFLDSMGHKCRTKPEIWRRYLEEIRRRISGPAVDLGKLAGAVDWLQNHQPDGEQLPPRMRLTWLTVQLAQANSQGKTETDWQKELENLAPKLLEEDAPMVCQADLHLAVARTNRFDFIGASQALDRWEAFRPIVPGLRHWARVQSSLGQHAAFRGEHDDAIFYFREALEAFARLSDPAERQSDKEKTQVYLAIAMMDNPKADPAEVFTVVRNTVAGPKTIGFKRYNCNLRDAIAGLAISADSPERYLHHLILRWLGHARPDEEFRNIYLEQRSNWQIGSGHPWPLILLYRAMLLNDIGKREDAADLANEAFLCATSPGQGPLVRLIGLCCRAIALRWGHKGGGRHASKKTGALTKEIPLAKQRIEFLQKWRKKTGDPLELLQNVLPFNFR